LLHLTPSHKQLLLVHYVLQIQTLRMWGWAVMFPKSTYYYFNISI